MTQGPDKQNAPGARPATRTPDTSGPVSFDSPEWKERIAEARAKREKVIAARSARAKGQTSKSKNASTTQKKGHADKRPPATPVTSGGLSFRDVFSGVGVGLGLGFVALMLFALLVPKITEAPLAEERAKLLQQPQIARFDIVQPVHDRGPAFALPDRMPAPYDVPPMRMKSVLDQPAPSGAGTLPEYSDVVTRAATPDLGLSPRVASRSQPDLNLVVVTSEAHADLGDVLGVLPQEIRLTAFHVPENSVHVFNDADLPTAERLAGVLDAQLVDLRGMRPAQPEGTITVYLAN